MTLTDTPWRAQAVCRGMPPELFYDEEHLETAKTICAGCPVKDECLAYGLERGEAGMWGGKYLGYHARSSGLLSEPDSISRLSAVSPVLQVPPRSSLGAGGNKGSPPTQEEGTEMATNQAETKAESMRTTEKASDHFEPVSKALREAGVEGITLAQLSESTGIRGRVLHNVLYRLEKAEKVRRIQEGKGRKVLYASTEVKVSRSRAPKSTAAKKSTTARKATTKAA